MSVSRISFSPEEWKDIRTTCIGYLIGGLILLLIYGAFQLVPTPQITTPSKKPHQKQEIPVLTEGATDEQLARGTTLYASQCAGCHGATGRGDGPAAHLLMPKPRNLTDSNSFRIVSRPDRTPSVDDLYMVITRGMPLSAMPSFELLSDEDRWSLAFYVKSLHSKEVRPKARISSIPYTLPSYPIGKAHGLYLNHCKSCHGDEDKGGTMSDPLGYPTHARDFTAGIFKGTNEPLEIYRRIALGMPGSVMPAHPQLSEEQIWLLVNYVKTRSNLDSDEQPTADQGVLHSLTIPVEKRAQEDFSNPRHNEWLFGTESLGLMPLWWRDEYPRNVIIHAVYTSTDLYVCATWSDATGEQRALKPQDFRDGVAVQLSGGHIPPFLGMGHAGTNVPIWHWKSDKQMDLNSFGDVQTQYPNMYVMTYPGAVRGKETNDKMGIDYAGTNDARSRCPVDLDQRYLTARTAGNIVSQEQNHAAESLSAHGMGSLGKTSAADTGVTANGYWENGKYKVVFKRPLNQGSPQGINITPGREYFIAFAVWDGAAGDRNGQKCITVWHKIKIVP